MNSLKVPFGLFCWLLGVAVFGFVGVQELFDARVIDGIINIFIAIVLIFLGAILILSWEHDN